MAVSHHPESASVEAHPPGAPAREIALVHLRLKRGMLFILVTLVKAAYISFWYNFFSVIRLQAGW